jgi:hypothetical protein
LNNKKRRITFLPDFQIRIFFYEPFDEEIRMLEVSEQAIVKLKAYLADNNIESAVRVALMQGG